MQMRTIPFILFFLSVSAFSIAQSQRTIVGVLPQAVDKQIVIRGFNVEGDSELAAAKRDAQGKFKLVYPPGYVGAALFEIKGAKSVIVLLNNEDFEINWGNLEDFRV
jgi:hypothetical protein